MLFVAFEHTVIKALQPGMGMWWRLETLFTVHGSSTIIIVGSHDAKAIATSRNRGRQTPGRAEKKDGLLGRTDCFIRRERKGT